MSIDVIAALSLQFTLESIITMHDMYLYSYTHYSHAIYMLCT